MRPIPEELAELQAMKSPALVERYMETFGRLPRVKQPDWLRRKIAWELQARRLGGLSKMAKARLEELIGEIDLPVGGARKQIKPARNWTALGTTVSRIWKGRLIQATAVEGGLWEYEGVRYRSLTAVANHVTGSHWNGKYWFGLSKRRAPK